MGIGNLGFPEILIILVIVLLLFGAKRIPEIAGSMGKGIREFKRSMTDVNKALTEPEHESLPGERLPAARVEAQTDKDDDRPEPKRLLN